YVVRIANIDAYDLQAGRGETPKLMPKARSRMTAHRVTWLGAAMSPTHAVPAAQRGEAPTPSATGATSPVRLRPMEVDGFEVMSYRGIPVRQVDAIVNTEARVVNETGS